MMRAPWWLGIVVLAALAAGCSPPKQPAQATMLDGQPVTIEQFEGKPLVLNFWATWCPPCRMEMPELERAYRNYEGRGIQFLAVALDDPDDARQFVREQKVTFPVAADKERVLGSKYRVTAIPTTYFLNSDGTVAEKFIGAREYADFEAAIKKLK